MASTNLLLISYLHPLDSGLQLWNFVEPKLVYGIPCFLPLSDPSRDNHKGFRSGQLGNKGRISWVVRRFASGHCPAPGSANSLFLKLSWPDSLSCSTSSPRRLKGLRPTLDLRAALHHHDHLQRAQPQMSIYLTNRTKKGLGYFLQRIKQDPRCTRVSRGS